MKNRNEHSPEYKVIAVQDRSLISEDDEKLFGQLEAEGLIIVRCDKGETLSDSLMETGIVPDIKIVSDNMPESKVYFCHRRTDDADIYFVYNHSDKAYRSSISIRSDYRHIELWDPMTAERRDPKENILELDPYSSIFIIAR